MIAKRHAPATSRNREAILEVLASALPAAPGRRTRVLEIASGTGEHAIHFASRMPHVDWVPSDPDADARASVAAHREEAALPNVAAPREIDVTRAGWSAGIEADAVVCINMIHIAPWEACLGLLEGASLLLGPGGALVLYGPYRFDGRFTAPSNEAFDASLRERDPRWGVRDLGDVTREAEARGLTREAVIALPANNHAVLFRRV